MGWKYTFFCSHRFMWRFPFPICKLVNSSCSPLSLRSASRWQCCSFNVSFTWKSINFPKRSSSHWQIFFVFENAFREIRPFQSLHWGRNSSKSTVTEHLVGCFWHVFDMSQKLIREDWMFNWLEFVTEKYHRDFVSPDTRVVWSLAEKHPESVRASTEKVHAFVTLSSTRWTDLILLWSDDVKET